MKVLTALFVTVLFLAHLLVVFSKSTHVETYGVRSFCSSRKRYTITALSSQWSTSVEMGICGEELCRKHMRETTILCRASLSPVLSKVVQ
jgi:hypothetical protein